MDCNEFSYPIIAVSLLQNGTDIVFNVPANADAQDVVTLSEKAGEHYAQLITNDDGAYGTPLLSDASSCSLESTLNSKQGGQYQKVMLEYKNTHMTTEETNSFLSQQAQLRQNCYSLLIEFFDGTYGLVRCLAEGDGYLFSSKSNNSTTTSTINITNMSGIQKVSSIELN